MNSSAPPPEPMHRWQFSRGDKLLAGGAALVVAALVFGAMCRSGPAGSIPSPSPSPTPVPTSATATATPAPTSLPSATVPPPPTPPAGYCSPAGCQLPTSTPAIGALGSGGLLPTAAR